MDTAFEALTVTGPDDPRLRAMINPIDADAVIEEIALAKSACRPFDLAAFRAGHLSPVLFGSALRNFGVRDLIDALAEFAPAPLPQRADRRTVAPDEPALTGFIFKIQANMDPTTATASPFCASAPDGWSAE